MLTAVVPAGRPLVSSINRIKPLAHNQQWVALLRSDYALTTRTWFDQLYSVVSGKTQFDLYLTACSPAPSWQQPARVPSHRNMINHRQFGARLALQQTSIVPVAHDAPEGGEGLILVSVRLLNRVRWGDPTFQAVATRHKASVGLIPNLYVVKP